MISFETEPNCECGSGEEVGPVHSSWCPRWSNLLQWTAEQECLREAKEVSKI